VPVIGLLNHPLHQPEAKTKMPARALTRGVLVDGVEVFGKQKQKWEAGRALTYQKVFEVQARQMRRCIESGLPDYAPFLAK